MFRTPPISTLFPYTTLFDLLVLAQGERHGQVLLDPLGQACCVVDVMDIVQENRELISPKTSDRVSGTQALLQPSRYGDEKFIPNQVSEAVVDDLEAIDVQEENCVEIISRAFCASDCKLQTVAEQGPVGETCQLIMKHIVEQLFFDQLAIGDIRLGP